MRLNGCCGWTWYGSAGGCIRVDGAAVTEEVGTRYLQKAPGRHFARALTVVDDGNQPELTTKRAQATRHCITPRVTT